ncbi:terminase small subunit [Buttiauxella sp. A111]|uniref:terminase small subunit n=1 Tax=Buttiauxella sp. A111 TaxID=2563088 RepID=UPI002714AFBE|nr:terminase small subunit [Buttiauxella sp. A111]
MYTRRLPLFTKISEKAGCCLVVSLQPLRCAAFAKKHTNQPPEKSTFMSIYLNKKDMAASLHISVQAFDKWGVEPSERRGREALYDVRSVLNNRLLYQGDAQKKESTGEELDEDIKFERHRLLKAQADELERENARKEALLVDTAFCTFVLIKITGEVASILDTIPLAYQRKFPGLEKRHIDHLKNEIIKARNIAAKTGDLVPSLLNEYLNSTDK